MKPTKIAVVYDWFDKWGGVERILLTFAEMFPEAVFYTSYYDEKKAPWAKNLKVKTSFIQKFPAWVKRNRIISIPFYPYAFENFDFSDYDLVISVTSSFAKGIVTQPKTKHICYCLTPSRFLWLYQDLYIPIQFQVYLFSRYIKYLKSWDLVVGQRPDQYIAISKTVQDRIKKYYHRDSHVVYPPFDFFYWEKIKSEIRNSKSETNSKLQIPNSKFYLVVSRLEPYKMVKLVIKVFNKMPEKNLIIIGKGTKLKPLMSIAQPNITFLQDLTDQQLALYYKKAQALIMAQCEDFGYTSLEAQFFGCPVIAYKKGGAIETIIEGKTGLFFDEQKEKSLYKVVQKYKKIAVGLKENTRRMGPENCQRFDKKIFIDRINRIITKLHK